MLQIKCIELDAAVNADKNFHTVIEDSAWLLLLLKTRAVFTVNDSDAVCPAHSIVLYKPKQAVTLRAVDGIFRCDYISFMTDEPYITGANIPFGMPSAVYDPAYYHSLFHLMAEEHAHGGDLKEISIDKLMQVLFNKLSQLFEIKPKTQLSKSIHDLKKDIYTRPDEQWSVKLMADMLNISPGHLENTYKSTFGISCMEDVIISRIALAKKYLQNSSYSIAEIIARCGYRSSEHFYRQFKKVTGVTPRGYRLHAQHSGNMGCERPQKFDN